MQLRVSSGFTLVEVIVALALLVVLTVGVVRLFGVAIEAGRAARDRTMAVVLAIGKVEQLR
jgi:prepilin-type N-terminal cleavage/methylation domain-containing protein